MYSRSKAGTNSNRETANLHSMHLAVSNTDACNKTVMVTESSTTLWKGLQHTWGGYYWCWKKKVSFLPNSEMTGNETTIFFCACTNASLRERSHSFCVLCALDSFKHIQEFTQSRGERKKKKEIFILILKKKITQQFLLWMLNCYNNIF